MRQTSEKLRALLDRRGVIHHDIADSTFWEDTRGVKWCAQDLPGHDELHLQAMTFVPPETAVEIALGAGSRKGGEPCSPTS